MAAGRPQGGRAADFGGGDGTIIAMVREYVTPKAVIETAGGDSSTGEFRAPPAGSEQGRGVHAVAAAQSAPQGRAIDPDTG
ncbi:hypothetical protein QA640_16705 [Bradyrhizobium sp. CB82]|uniref:hypothetical protein n=1 Tax=Bradyrhizobium sp. CB82 TaxID=3039159 RepID=UPI0024B15FD1|nr:hypothetical protein [Bradyrhizobium sp. CB82]WFU43937.1 hypothetical protein QA640_16705 [Bradyrhizobium sp. CB82]